MVFIQKYIERYIYLIILILFGNLIVLLSLPNEYREYQIRVIEELIHSNNNNIECKIPELPINNPEIMKFYYNVSKDIFNCGNENNNWIQCKKSICSVKESILLEKGNITCIYKDILRVNDYKIYYGKPIKVRDSYTLRKSDFVKVNCKSVNSDRWRGYGVGIRENLKNKLNENNFYNILIFGFDSLSHNAFIRKLPKTYEYLTKILKSNVLNGYNIVGDGTPQALIPILTGYNELELPETRNRIIHSGYVDLYPMVWNEYKKNGYVTSFNEDLPSTGVFTFRLNGFKNQPTDHYMRTLYLETENYLTSFPSVYCIGNKNGHDVMLDYTKDFMIKYNKIPRFIFSFHGQLSHGSINLIGKADDDVNKWLRDLHRQNLLDNTILIMMSDHGNRFAAVRRTLQGKQEERLPFFSLTLPNSFKRKFPKSYENVIKNVNRLTTPYDIHATLLDLLNLQNLNINIKSIQKKHKKNIPQRGISLFQSIPSNRSCSMAYIEPHWCSCLQWENLNNINSDFIKILGNTVVNTINNYTKNYRNLCENLYLSDIKWAIKLKPNDKLISFKESKDMDGRLPDMSSKMKIKIELYQININVLPGNSIFEATLSHNIVKNIFNVKLSQISRINKYGKQANCIYDINPDLRKYCYCRNQT